MRTLDFLPDWYRADRQRRRRQHRHYILFGLITALVAGWSFMLDRSVSGLHAESRQMEAVIEEGRQSVQTVLELELQIDRLRRQTEILNALTPRTEVGVILAELAYCVGERVVFDRIGLAQSPIENNNPAPTSSVGPMRIGAARPKTPSPLPEGPQQWRVTLVGIAADGGTVAQLIDRLETSDYFEAVSLGFSRAATLGDIPVTEFEITCTVEDYTLLRQH